MFILLVALAGWYPLGMKYYYDGKQDVFRDSTTKFITCLMTEGVNDADAASDICGSAPKQRPSYETIIASIFVICAYGMVITDVHFHHQLY